MKRMEERLRFFRTRPPFARPPFAPLFRVVGVALVGMLLAPTSGKGQAGARMVAPPIPATVPVEVASRARGSDAQLVLGDINAALQVLFPGFTGPHGVPERPEWSLLRSFALARPPGSAMQVEVSARLGRMAAGGYETAWRAARIAMALGMLAQEPSDRTRWHTWGILWGMEAVALDPDPAGTESRFWLLANVGRMALDPLPELERGRASEVIYDVGQAILAREPNHAGALVVLGRNHLEVRSQNLATRTLARVIFGNDFVARSSFELALEHLERGARQDSGMVYYQLEWAHGLAARGRHDEARRVWTTIESLPPRHVIDGVLQAEASRRLRAR